MENQQKLNQKRIVKKLVSKAYDLEYKTTQTDAIEDISLIQLYGLQQHQIKALRSICQGIKTLSLKQSFNELYEDILKIQSLRKLQVNGIRGMIFPSTWISKMSQLKILLITQRMIEDIHLSQILKGIPLLQDLTIGQTNKLTGEFIETLKELKHLTSLTFHRIDPIYSNIIKSIFENLTLLKSIDFADCQFENEKDLLGIEKLINLNSFHLSWTEINKQTFSSLTNCLPVQLSSIYKIQLKPEDFEKFLEKYCNLNSIKLQWCYLFDSKLKLLSKSKLKLNELSLSSNNNISDIGIQSLLSSQLNLKILNLNYCHRITDKSFQIISQLKELQQLNLLNCDKITNKGIIKLKQLRNLKTIEFGKNKISEYVFLKLFIILKSLKKLIIDEKYQQIKSFKEQKRQVTKIWIKYD